MEPLCEFCGMVRALVYCKSDSARLCLRCDNFVHSANCFARRHPRSLLCDECNSQPAVVRCADEKMSLCQDCDSWNGNGPNGCSGIGHSRQTLSSYSGCPSQDELLKIWFSVLDGPHSCGGFDAIWDPSTTLPINENWRSHSSKPNGNEGSVSVGLVTNKLNELQPCSKFDPLISPFSVMPFNQICLPPRGKDQVLLFEEGSNLPKGHSSYKNLEIHDTEYLCDELNVDDAALSFESCAEMFGSLQGHSKYNFDDGRTDCQIMDKTVSVTESNGHVEKALEESSLGQQECKAFQSSCVAGSANLTQAMMSASGNDMLINPSYEKSIYFGFLTKKVHSSTVSLSDITGESSVGDYQDCGSSPAFLMGKSPWDSNMDVTCTEAREKAKMRYNEKKQRRMFGKQIRYASRKARADTKKRVKGRFVKAGEAYDYDPLVTRRF